MELRMSTRKTYKQKQKHKQQKQNSTSGTSYKKFAQQKKPISKMERQPAEWENIKNPYSSIKNEVQLKNGQGNSKENIQMNNKYTKNAEHH